MFTHMNKTRTLIVMCITIFVVCIAFGWAWAGPPEWVYSSGVKTASAKILTGEGFFDGIVVKPDGTNAITVTFYDNTAGSGTQFLPSIVIAGDGGTAFLNPVRPIKVFNGIYITVAGDGTENYTVLYRPAR